MTIEGQRPPLPQVPYLGGTLLTKLQIVTVTFQGYPYEQQVQGFGDWVVSSNWLTSVGNDYGVGGNAVHLRKVVLTDKPASTLALVDVAQLLTGRILDGTLPPPTDGILYLVYFPSSVTLTLDGTATSCQVFGGYHGEAETQQGMKFPFAAVPTCVGLSSLGDLASIEEVASHELIEAATDPFPDTGPGYRISDTTNPWSLEPEVGDLCTTLSVPESGYTVQRIWSNSAAAAGQQPCIPASSGIPYLVTSASDAIPSVTPGTAVTFQLTGYATTAVPDWNLDLSHPFGFNTAPVLGRTTLNDGQQTTLTLTVPTGIPSGQVAGLLLISSETGVDPARWVVAVRAQ
jgi:hypothetical protein